MPICILFDPGCGWQGTEMEQALVYFIDVLCVHRNNTFPSKINRVIIFE